MLRLGRWWRPYALVAVAGCGDALVCKVWREMKFLRPWKPEAERLPDIVVDERSLVASLRLCLSILASERRSVFDLGPSPSRN